MELELKKKENYHYRELEININPSAWRIYSGFLSGYSFVYREMQLAAVLAFVIKRLLLLNRN